MVQDLFFVGNSGNTNQSGIEITITTDNGTFVVNPSGVGVFYGLPPGFTGSYPKTYYNVAANQLDFQGNINNVYSEFWVQSNDTSLSGTITVNPALPQDVSIGSYGGNGSFSLPAGKTSAQFKIPIANYGTETQEQRTSRLTKIVGKSE
jgi:hypothetical protein